MTAVQLLTGSGGWPMSVWLTPDRAPFFGGTYFPPRDGARGAPRGFLAPRRAAPTCTRDDPARVARRRPARSSSAVAQALGGRAAGAAGGAARGAARSRTAVAHLRARLRRAPRRAAPRAQVPVEPAGPAAAAPPPPHAATRRRCDMATLTLEKMAAGGIHDQLGGGFHRYSTDARWLVPHFEKMLYDNALLAVAYAEAWQVTGRARLRARRPADARLPAARDDLARGRLLLGDRRRLGGRGGAFFVWTRGGAPRGARRRTPTRFIALPRRHRRRGTSRGATSSTCRAPDEGELGGARAGRARELYDGARARGPARSATRRCSPPGTAC